MLTLMLRDTASLGAGDVPQTNAGLATLAGGAGKVRQLALATTGLADSLEGLGSFLWSGEDRISPGALSVRRLLAKNPDMNALYSQARLLLQANSAPPRIALAFDDYPFPEFSPRLLSLLAETQTPVTFFTIGNKLEKAPHLAALALMHGHSLQNHTYSHPRLDALPSERVRQEWREGAQVIRALTGQNPTLSRAPGERSNDEVWRESQACGMLCVDPLVSDIYDMGKSARVIENRCMELAGPGVILSLHDGVPETLEALPHVIGRLRARGYQFVTVEELFAPKKR